MFSEARCPLRVAREQCAAEEVLGLGASVQGLSMIGGSDAVTETVSHVGLEEQGCSVRRRRNVCAYIAIHLHQGVDSGCSFQGTMFQTHFSWSVRKTLRG